MRFVARRPSVFVNATRHSPCALAASPSACLLGSRHSRTTQPKRENDSVNKAAMPLHFSRAPCLHHGGMTTSTRRKTTSTPPTCTTHHRSSIAQFSSFQSSLRMLCALTSAWGTTCLLLAVLELDGPDEVMIRCGPDTGCGLGGVRTKNTNADSSSSSLSSSVSSSSASVPVALPPQPRPQPQQRHAAQGTCTGAFPGARQKGRYVWCMAGMCPRSAGHRTVNVNM
jgi:hypothetical protein